MGLLGKAIAINNARRDDIAVFAGDASGALKSLIIDYHHKNPLFHGIIFSGVSPDIEAMLDGHGVACGNLSGGNSLALLPGGLDRELFAHLLSRSVNLAILSQFSANSVSPAFEALGI